MRYNLGLSLLDEGEERVPQFASHFMNCGAVDKREMLILTYVRDPLNRTTSTMIHTYDELDKYMIYFDSFFSGLPRLDDLAFGARAPQHAAHADGADALLGRRRRRRAEIRMRQTLFIQSLDGTA